MRYQRIHDFQSCALDHSAISPSVLCIITQTFFNCNRNFQIIRLILRGKSGVFTAFSYAICLLTSAAATTLTRCRRTVVTFTVGRGTGKLVNWECERTEQAARIVRLRLNTFLVGHSVVSTVYKNLCRPNHTYDREQDRKSVV